MLSPLRNLAPRVKQEYIEYYLLNVPHRLTPLINTSSYQLGVLMEPSKMVTGTAMYAAMPLITMGLRSLVQRPGIQTFMKKPSTVRALLYIPALRRKMEKILAAKHGPENVPKIMQQLRHNLKK